MTKHTASEVFEAKVQRKNGCWEFDGFHDRNGYARVYWAGRQWLAHRLSWTIHNGPIPEGMQIDHICHNTGCVNPGHLRVVTGKQNVENKPTPRSDNTTGVKGVWWRSDRERYMAQVTHNGVRVLRKSFENLEDAEAAVIEARRKWFTHNDYDHAA